MTGETGRWRNSLLLTFIILKGTRGPGKDLSNKSTNSVQSLLSPEGMGVEGGARCADMYGGA